MAGLIQRLTGAGFVTGAQPTEPVDAPVFTGALAEPVGSQVPVGTRSTGFTVAGTESLSAAHLNTIFPMGAPVAYKVGAPAPVPKQLEGFEKMQPTVLVVEPPAPVEPMAPIVTPGDAPQQRSSYGMLETPNAAAEPLAAEPVIFGDIPAPAAVTEAVEPVAPVVESLAAPAVDTSAAAPEPAKKDKTKKSKKTKDGKVKAGKKSKKGICC